MRKKTLKKENIYLKELTIRLQKRLDYYYNLLFSPPSEEKAIKKNKEE